MQRRGSTVGLALGLPLVLIVSLLFFIVLTQPKSDCAPGNLGIDVPAEPVAVTTRAPFTARVASWNTLAANTTGNILRGIDGLRAASDVIGFQELNPESRRSSVEKALHSHGWAISAGNNSVQIAWNAAKYTMLAQGSEKVFDVERIEGGTAGTSIGPKSVQWVQLQSRQSGGVFFVVNHHVVPDIDRSGHPRPGAPKRIALYQRQMAAMLSVVQKLRVNGPVAVTGDFNVAAKADAKVKDPRFPYVLMNSAGFGSNWSKLGYPSQGTHSGGRLIDYVWLTTQTGRFVDQRILARNGSDHNPVVAAITNTAGDATGAGSTAPQPTAAAAGPAAQLPASLTVQMNGQQVKLGRDQLEVAATAIREGKALNVPERGWIVAIAAALQESGLRNLNGGDRDSVGPWQMRPSTGWGTVEQIRNVQLAARAFYGMADHTQNPGLVDIAGWEQMTIGKAAQAVERSAFPDAYDKWEPAARTIVQQLAGAVGTSSTDPGCPTAPGADLSGECPATNLPAEKVLTPDALLVLRCVSKQFPAIRDISTYPGHEPDQSRAVDIMIPAWDSPSGRELGNQIAAWVKDHRTELGVHYVIWHAQIWNIDRDGEGWRPYASITGEDNANSLHYNHVHVSVWGDKGTGPADAIQPPLTALAWHTPVGEPSSVGCGFNCYAHHTGQDFPAPPGTPVYAVSSGTVVRSESITTTGTCTELPICGGTRISYGNLIVIKLAGRGDVTAYYAHLSARSVRQGQTVQPGQVIGAVGYEGNVKPKGPGGSHLHFEIRRDGTPVNPLQYLQSKGIKP